MCDSFYVGGECLCKSKLEVLIKEAILQKNDKNGTFPSLNNDHAVNSLTSTPNSEFPHCNLEFSLKILDSLFLDQLTSQVLH